MLWLIRFILIVLIIYLFYRSFKYIVDPKRKLELAQEQKRFYFLDDQENVRKNFHLTYKGVLFEGEKYLGTTEKAFEVVSIFVWTNNASSLQGLRLEDFHYLQDEIHERYPNAKIDWKSPINEFLQTSDT
ncbi:sigma-w pathway protein ysdB [Rossellomorea aquimaris]|uniref:sigma-w pathway protein ysdB n=1 Tax=Rossellomorea aquimaris TaxID=189382 RepID=UPI001CD7763D|nr:sigma-w pathway protein ysdB [Rossellomorea aquimaris]MCA1056395.1 sigma-w pathway protein ysdB [Rossellomorea aquimaris]